MEAMADVRFESKPQEQADFFAFDASETSGAQEEKQPAEQQDFFKF